MLSTNFIDIRKQVFWGNKFITLNNKPLFYSNWMDIEIIIINDVLDDKDILEEKIIFEKLNNKTNWIIEVASLKQAIPKDWLNVLKGNDSRKTEVNFPRNSYIFRNEHINLNQISNNVLYKKLIEDRVQKRIGIKT